MPLSPAEQAFAENILIEGLIPAPKLGHALKLKESQGGKKPLPNVLAELKLIAAEEAKRLWKVAEAGVKACPPAAFSFSEGAMMGPYELVEPRGSFLAGDHWRGKRPEGMGFVRFIPPGTDMDPQRAQRLIDRANAGVESPDETILRVDDAGEEFNWLYTGTIGFDGRSLATRLSRGALPEAEAIVLGKTVARALGVAHGFGVVHAGLSPMAVLYGSDGKPKITDFGVGSVFFDGPAAGMRPGGRLGLLLYAAPELVRGGAEGGLDGRADLYSLGALLYDAVSSIRLNDVRAAENDPWLVQPAGVSDGFLTMLRRLLALDLEERYPSMDALAQDLERLEQGALPGPLPPPGPPLLVAPRPETARPLELVTPELLARSELPDTPSDSGLQVALPEGVGVDQPEPEEIPDPNADPNAIELAPPTVDPDAEPRRGRRAAPFTEEPPPPTDDPDRPRAARIPRKTSARLTADLDMPGKPVKKSHGLGQLVGAIVLVGGGFVGLTFATAPDPETLARLDLGRATLAAAKERDYGKAERLIAQARSQGGQAVADEALALELDVRRRRIAEYRVAKKANDPLGARRAVEGSKNLVALVEIDDGRLVGSDLAQRGERLLEVGLVDEALRAFKDAGDSAFAERRKQVEGFAKLGAFLPRGKYPGAKIDLPKSLFVGASEVTRVEYATWLERELAGAAHPYKSCHPACPGNHVPEKWSAKQALAANDKRPMTNVTWFDAYSYASAHGWRLASMGELLAAAQGPFPRKHPWGPGDFAAAFANGDKRFAVEVPAPGEKVDPLLPAGTFPEGASPIGAQDLLGNAEEWTLPEGDVAANTEIPLFGGNADTGADGMVLGGEPAKAPADQRSVLRGFRCVAELTETSKKETP